MSRFRAWFKLVVVVIVLIGYTLSFYVVTFFKGKTVQRGFRFRSSFCRMALRILGIEYTHQGKEYPEGACLYVSNHRSLLDPLIQLGYINAFIVSKAEVGDYPLIGNGSKETGIILVKRESQSSRKAALAAIEKTLLSGYPVMIYPEGTTNGNDLTKEFRRGAIELAFRRNIPIVPVMIEYPNEDYYWVNGSFMEYFLGKISQKGKHQVWGKVGEQISPAELNTVANDTRKEIDQMIMELRSSVDRTRSSILN